MSSLVIAEIFIYKNESSSGEQNAERLFITFYPNSGTQFTAHTSLSDARNFVLNESIKKTIKKNPEQISSSTNYLKFKFIESDIQLSSLDKKTTQLIDEYSKSINLDSLYKTFISLIEQRTLKEALKNNVNLLSKNDPNKL